jgi:hypothetical protein
MVGEPGLYCNGVYRCDPRWFPDELNDYEFKQYGGEEYLCRNSPTGTSKDLDCFWYLQGDPESVFRSRPNLFCSDTTPLECREDGYPSELDGLFFLEIDGVSHVCNESPVGFECFEWSGFGSPVDAIDFSFYPDYYCNFRWECSRHN